MDRIKALVREPALLIDLAETLVLFALAFGISLTHDQQTYIVAAVVAALGLLKGFMTTPFPATVIPDFGRAVLVLGASFGLNLSADQITVAVTLLGTITTIIARSQITPRNDKIVDATGAGAGPVTNQAGYATLELVGIVVTIVGLLLLLLSLLDAIAVSLIVAVVVTVVGLVIVILGRRTI